MRRDISRKNSTSSSTIPSTRTSCRLSSSTVRSSSVSKTNSKSLSRRLSKDTCPCRRSFPQRRKSWTRRQRKWRTPTVGSSLRTHRCLAVPSKRISRSSSSSQRLSRTSAPTSTSSRRSQSSQLRSSKTPSTHPSSWNLRKRSTGFSAPMPSISQSASCIRMRLRGSTRSWRTSRCPPLAASSLSRSKLHWCRGRKYLAMPNAWSSSVTKARSDRFIKGSTPAMLWIAVHPWSVWSSPVSRIRSRCSRRNRRRRSSSAQLHLSSLREKSSRKWSRLRLAKGMPAIGRFERPSQYPQSFCLFETNYWPHFCS